MCEEVKMFDQIIKEWSFPSNKFIDISGRYRIYYNERSKEEKVGFDFIVLHFTSSYILEGNPFDDLSQTSGEVLFHGNAYFDGIRHFHIGAEVTNNEGYFNYPRVNELAIILNKLHDLEKQFCVVEEF